MLLVTSWCNVRLHSNTSHCAPLSALLTCGCCRLPEATPLSDESTRFPTHLASHCPSPALLSHCAQSYCAQSQVTLAHALDEISLCCAPPSTPIKSIPSRPQTLTSPNPGDVGYPHEWRSLGPGAQAGLPPLLQGACVLRSIDP